MLLLAECCLSCVVRCVLCVVACFLVGCHLLFVFFVMFCVLRVVHYLSFAVCGCLLFGVCCRLLFVVRCCLVFAGCRLLSLCVVRCSLSIVVVA